jgi:mycothiol synthase
VLTVEVADPAGGASREEVLDFLAASGTRPSGTGDLRPVTLSEHKMIGLRTARPSAVGVVARDRGTIVAYGQLELRATRAAWEAVLPDDPDPAAVEETSRALLEAAERVAASRGISTIEWFVTDPSADAERLLDALGFSTSRELLLLSRDVLGPSDEGTPSETFTPFRVGIDEAAWLTLNARAFAAHPEQRAWDATTLAEREAEPWFDPDGFLLAWRDGVLAGACWTKIHPGPPEIGEIYVIGVDPAFQGRRLGTSLLAAGIAYLERSGVAEISLYVESENAAAIALYRASGFVTASRTVIADRTVHPS